MDMNGLCGQVRKSQGLFLYTYWTHLRLNPQDPDLRFTLHELNAFPQGLDMVYMDNFTRLKATRSDIDQICGPIGPNLLDRSGYWFSSVVLCVYL